MRRRLLHEEALVNLDVADLDPYVLGGAYRRPYLPLVLGVNQPFSLLVEVLHQDVGLIRDFVGKRGGTTGVLNQRESEDGERDESARSDRRYTGTRPLTQKRE